MTQNTGSPAGNPGYSFASRWSLKRWRSTGQGYYTVVVWVGKEGKDTPEAREIFEAWLAESTIVDPTKVVYSDK